MERSRWLGPVAALLLAALVGLGVYIVVVRSKEAQAVDNWSRGIDLVGGALGTLTSVLGGSAGLLALA